MLKQREQPFFNLSAAYGTAKIHRWMVFFTKRYFTERSVLLVCQRGPHKHVIYRVAEGEAISSFVRSYTFSSTKLKVRPAVTHTDTHTHAHWGAESVSHLSKLRGPDSLSKSSMPSETVETRVSVRTAQIIEASPTWESWGMRSVLEFRKKKKQNI